MDRKQLIKKYLEFFKSKGHKIIPSASLIPENDPTVLFTTAGMHPLVPYLQGEKHPLGKKLVNVQRCIRTGDIEEVGDKFHHTFFEMLGNWSLGDYWKKEAIKMTFEFYTKILGMPIEKLNTTCFKGDKNAPKDTESEKIWKDLGIKKIKFLDKKENWWGPAGKTGPCGPDTEIFYNDIEIGNNVLMQYNKDAKGKYNEAKQKNMDFGGGTERTVTVLNNLDDNYLTNSFKPIIEIIEKLSKKKYGKDKENTKSIRVVADHIKAAVMILADGIIPGNVEQGYVLRRLIRRAVRYGRKLKIKDFTLQVAEPVFKIYDDYQHLKDNKKEILNELEKEEKNFQRTIEKGLNRFIKFTTKQKRLGGKEAFLLYQSFGFPIELIEEECKKNKIKFKVKDFEKEQKKHQELSRTATKGKFKAGLADNSEQTTKLHTATHLLHAALKKVLGKHVEQRGSNITPERLRFDFTHPQKMTDNEKKEVEEIINNLIEKKLPINLEEMPYKEAVKKGAESFFRERYPEIVKVYSVENFSKEICAGPHIKNTKELGKFKIIKETSSSAGIRRIKAILE